MMRIDRELRAQIRLTLQTWIVERAGQLGHSSMLEKKVPVNGITACGSFDRRKRQWNRRSGSGTVAISVDDDLDGIQPVAQTFIAHLSTHQVGCARKELAQTNAQRVNRMRPRLISLRYVLPSPSRSCFVQKMSEKLRQMGSLFC